MSHKPSMQHPRAGPELTSEDREDPVNCEFGQALGPPVPHTHHAPGDWQGSGGVPAGPQTVTAVMDLSFAVGLLGEYGADIREMRNGCWSLGDTRTPR